MKAVVLAGGFGTRLRPMTFSRPKVLFPVVNKPILDRILDGLRAAGVYEVILCLNYMAEVIQDHYPGGRYLDMTVRFALEREPLGIGGAIANAAPFLDGEPFLVLKGDILCNIDYRALMEAHGDGNRWGTIAVRRVRDPSRFDAVDYEGDRVLRFVEKPAPGTAPSKFVNAGTYLLSPKVLDLIPGGRELSIEREVFPRAADGGRLFAFQCNGSWYEIGTFEDYLRCNSEMIRAESLRGGNRVVIGENCRLGNGVVRGPAVIGDNVEIDRSTVVGPYVALGDDTVVCMGSSVESSVVFEEAHLGEHTRINGAVIGGGACISDYSKLEPGVVIGDGAHVAAHSILVVDVKVNPGRRVESSILQPGLVA